MILDIKRLVAQKSYQGSFSFEVDPQPSQLMIPLTSFEGKILVDGQYEIFDDDSVSITIDLTYRLQGKCSYCLKDIQKAIHYQDEVLFVPEDDDDNYVYDGKKIDLDIAVNDAILFSQPSSFLCSDDCKGIDFNEN